MGGVVERAEAAVGALLDAHDPARLSAGEAKALVGVYDRLERRLAARKVQLAARAAETPAVWGAEGDRTPAHWLARTTGTTVGAAVAALETSQRLEELPVTAAALAAGQLSLAQAAEVTAAAAVEPDAEPGLLAAAARESLRELRSRSEAIRAAAEDGEERERRIHRSRRLRCRRDADGAFSAELRTTAASGALLLAALEPYRRDVFDRARREGRREPQEAYLCDALLAMAEDRRRTARAGAGGRGTKIIVRVDHAALVRGHAVPGEVCDVNGRGPVSVSTVRRWADEGAFLAAVVTKGVDVVSVAHLGRTPTAHQETALGWRDLACSVQGCCTTTGLELDHVAEYATTGRTDVAQLTWLCRHHHQLKTHRGYRLGPPGPEGRRALQPPPVGEPP